MAYEYLIFGFVALVLLGAFTLRFPRLAIGVFVLAVILYQVEEEYLILSKLIGEYNSSLFIAFLGVYMVFHAIGAIGCLFFLNEKPDLDMGTHGSASWGGEGHLKRFFDKNGIFIGRGSRVSSKGHLLTIAPTRSGKGVGAIIPNLLSYEGSIICVDPKGENASITARRRRKINDDVFIIDPWNVVKDEKEKASINPIEFLCDNKDLAEDVAYIADALVYDPPSGSGDAHWNDEAKSLINGLLLYVVKEYPLEKNLLKLRELLTLDIDGIMAMFKVMQENDYSLIKRCANRMLSKSDKEFSGVLSNAQRHTQFLDSHRIEDSIKESSFDIVDLVRGRASVFIVIPPDKIGAFNRWLRIILTNLIMSLTRVEDKPKQDIMFFIDEFASIGRFKIIETAMGLMAGYGMKFWLFLQDLSQLKALYPDSYATFISNSSVLQIFGTNDYETAKYVSDSIGQTTIRTESVSMGKTFSENNQHSYSTTGVNLINPDEIMNMSDMLQIVFLEGKPMVLSKIRYWDDRFFKGLV